MAESDYLIAGLGNPGEKYDNTRHNVGFMALDHFAASEKCQLSIGKYKGKYCRTRLYGQQSILLKPETFMNLSGQCVAQFVRFFKIPMTNILILHDDLDLNVGRVKAVSRGGAGGHNGIRSLIQHLGHTDFARIKIGIGRPPRNDQGHGAPVEHYVLSKLPSLELQEISTVFTRTDQAIQLFLTQGIDDCMNRINTKGRS